MSVPDNQPAYEIEPYNRYFDVNSRLNEFDIRPGNTVTFMSLVDLTEVEGIRAAATGRKPSYTAFVAKAVALALREFPYANRRAYRRPWLPFLRRRLQKFHHCDVGIAVERDVPGVEAIAFVDILRDADRPSLAAITEWLQALRVCDVTTNEQWRGFSDVMKRFPAWLATALIRLPIYFPSLWVKYRGGAVLISSPAKYGIDAIATTWAWPLGVSFGLVKDRPVVRDGNVVSCRTFILTLNFDRRVMAGAQAGFFFKRIVDLLEHAAVELAPFLTSTPESEGSRQPRPVDQREDVRT